MMIIIIISITIVTTNRRWLNAEAEQILRAATAAEVRRAAAQVRRELQCSVQSYYVRCHNSSTSNYIRNIVNIHDITLLHKHRTVV